MSKKEELEKKMLNNLNSERLIMDEKIVGKCGYYCGCCPTYINGNCSGCTIEHSTGDCFTRDCVIENELPSCGHCQNFPCEMILTQPRTTILDKDWLQWKKQSNTNR